MRVFLTGATGFVGSAVVAHLLDAGHEVWGLARSDQAAEELRAAGAEVRRGDLRDLESLSLAAKAADAVIHTAFDHDFSRMPENCEMDRRAIEAMGGALAGTGKRLIVTAGLPPMAGAVAAETDLAANGAEGTPRVSEQTAIAFLARGVAISVIRMPQVHDRQKQGFGSYLLAHARMQGVSAYVDDGQNRWPAVHRLDAARLYGCVLTKGESGRIYHAVGEDGVAFREVAQAIGDRLEVPTISLAAEKAAGHFEWLERIARMDAPASSALTQAALQWRPSEPSGLAEDIRNST